MTEEEPVNTVSNRHRGQFVKGDPRINRKGRPRSFAALRKLAIKIATEGTPEDVTTIEKILRDWSKSRVPSDRYRFVETAYGKIPDQLDITTGGDKIIVRLVKDEDGS